MEAINHPSAMPLPPAAIARLLTRFSREQVEAFTAIAIDLLDLADGDTDLEDANDEEDAFTFTEYALAYGEGRGPGCEVSDAGGGNVEDEGEAIDEREPDYNEDHCQHYGINQTAPISEANPVIC